MAGGGIKINNNSIRGGADGITYTPRIGADGLLYFDPNRRGYNSIGGFVIKGEDGRDGADGLPGRDGAKGEKGATGAKLVAMVPDPANTGDGNKYTMYFDDGTVAEFVAPRGEKGDQGEKGEKGADGKDAEIIPTLEGNEADKAPSVQAVNDVLGGVANAIKGSKSGTSISLTDVSPITHNLSVKVSKEGVEDLSAVKVTARSKNMFNPDAWVNAIGRVTIDGIEYLNVREDSTSYYEIPGDSSTAYALCIRIIRNSDFEKGTNFTAKLTDGTTRSIGANFLPNGRRFPIVYGGEKLYFTGYGKTDICVDLSITQLELGTTHTDFVPYVEPTESTANADGTVNGIKSIYPITELSTDTDGAVIHCEYNKETNTALAEIAQNFGLTTERIRALDSLFMACAYIKDSASKEYNAFLSAFGLSPKLFAFTGSDFSQGGFYATNPSANYQSTVAHRCSIVGLNLPVDKYAGKEVAFYISGVSEALQTAMMFVTAEGLAVYGTQSLADLNIDAGSWFNSGDTYTIPDNAKYAWISVRKPDNSNITPEEIANIVIEEYIPDNNGEG